MTKHQLVFHKACFSKSQDRCSQDCHRIHTILVYCLKVENVLKGSLSLIPSPLPSVKIQIMGRKVCLRCKGKKFLGVVNKLFVFKSLLTILSNVLPYYAK